MARATRVARRRGLTLSLFGSYLAVALGIVCAFALVLGYLAYGAADQEWFKRAATSTEPFVGQAWQAGSEVLVRLCAPARAPQGQLRGVLAVDVLMRPVQEILARARLAPTTVAEVLTERGVVVA